MAIVKPPDELHEEEELWQRGTSGVSGLVTIGRDPSNEVVLSGDARASLHHAQLRRIEGRLWEILDLGSHNGTFVNGARVKRATLADGDIVAVGNRTFTLSDGLLTPKSATEDASLEAMGVRVVAAHDGATLLEDVSFSIDGRSLLAVVGPSGAGKTTLLRTLTGWAAPNAGSVRLSGRDLYHDYEELRARIGYVPQDDLVHPWLTVRQELDFAAALRLPPDLGGEERKTRVAEVISELELDECADTYIANLSGGQRKRTSVGIELLTQPALLFLDEPTSSLDPATEHHVMSVLRSLADGGRIVVVVTHATQDLSVSDRVLWLTRGGHVACFGPLSATLEFFSRNGVSGGFPEIFQVLESADASVWATRFRADPDHARYIDAAMRQAESLDRVPEPSVALPLTSPVKPLGQLGVLVRRQLRIIASDRRTLALLVLQAPLFGLLVDLLFPSQVFSTTTGPSAALVLWLLVVSATWLGASNTVREIVKERQIFRRERAAGLSVPAYLGSKIVVFGGTTVLQSAILVAVVLGRQRLPSRDPIHMLPAIASRTTVLRGLRPFAAGAVLSWQPVEIGLSVVMAGLAGMALGLAISARVRRSDQAILLLPVVLVVQMALSLPLLQAQNHSTVLRTLADFTSANWAMNAVAITTSLNQLLASFYVSNAVGSYWIAKELGRSHSASFLQGEIGRAIVGNGMWQHDPGSWWLSMGILVCFVAVLLGLTWLFLHRTSGHRDLFGADGAE